MVRLVVLLLLLASCAEGGAPESLAIHLDGRVRSYGGVGSGR